MSTIQQTSASYTGGGFTTPLPVVGAVLGGCAAIILMIIVVYFTRKDWQDHAQHPGQAASNGTWRQDVLERTAPAHPSAQAVQPADVWLDLKRPTPFLVIQPSSEMMFALKEIVIEPIEREPALPKGGLELEEDSSTHSLENQSSGASSSTRTSDETEMSAETTETDMRVSQAARPSGSSATSHESSSDQQSDGVSTFSRSTRMTRRTPFWVAGAADMRQDESQSHSLGLSVANHDPIPDLHCPEHPD